MAIVFEKHISCFSLYQINSNVSRTFLMFFEKKGWPNIYVYELYDLTEEEIKIVESET